MEHPFSIFSDDYASCLEGMKIIPDRLVQVDAVATKLLRLQKSGIYWHASTSTGAKGIVTHC